MSQVQVIRLAPGVSWQDQEKGSHVFRRWRKSAKSAKPTKAKMPRDEKGRLISCKRGHEFTPENAIVKPYTGKRECRICTNASKRARHAKKRESSTVRPNNQERETGSGFACHDPSSVPYRVPLDEYHGSLPGRTVEGLNEAV